MGEALVPGSGGKEEVLKRNSLREFAREGNTVRAWVRNVCSAGLALSR